MIEILPKMTGVILSDVNIMSGCGTGGWGARQGATVQKVLRTGGMYTCSCWDQRWMLRVTLTSSSSYQTHSRGTYSKHSTLIHSFSTPSTSSGNVYITTVWQNWFSVCHELQLLCVLVAFSKSHQRQFRVSAFFDNAETLDQLFSDINIHCGAWMVKLENFIVLYG